MSVGFATMKEMERPEASVKLDETGDIIRVSEFSMVLDLMGRELESPTTMRCWQGEVEVEDRWGIGSMSSRSEGCAPHDRFEILKKSKSRHRGSRRLHRAGRRVFSCFRHSTINLTVRDLEPSTPPKSGPLLVPRTGSIAGSRTSVSGASGVTFMDDAIDHHHHTDNNKERDVEEPTSPVVNCMGQVRSKKMLKHAKKSTEVPKEGDDMDRLRRTKSQAAPSSPPRVSKSMSCKWKQLLRSNSSSISPSNHPLCEGEPEIDLGRFCSASGGSSDHPLYRDFVAGDKRPDKTCMFMQRNNSTSGSTIPSTNIHDSSDDTQEELNARNSSGNYVDEGGERKTVADESHEPVFRNLPTLKTKRIESPKWLADEPVLNRRQGNLFKPSRMDSQIMKSSSHT